MVLKRTTVTLDEQVLQVASYKLSQGGSNVSEFCRFCLESLALEGFNLPNAVQVAAHEIVKEKIQELKIQKKIITETETAQAEAEEYERIRKKKVETAAKTILLKYPQFWKALPENDVYGDHCDVLERIMDEIRQTSGHEVELPEVKGIWQKMGVKA